MGVIRNIKNSIDDKSSMSVGSITLLISALIGAIIGLVVCFVLIYDVTTNGYVKTDLLDLGIFLMSGGAYIAGSGIPKTVVDSRMKTRSWQIEAEAEAELEDKYGRRKKRPHSPYYGSGNDEGEDEGYEDEEETDNT
jgi:hypothetical protein